MFVLNMIIIFVIWTWGLTPTWVNVVVTILASLALIDALDEEKIYDFTKKDKNR